jgi:hypothetical protein
MSTQYIYIYIQYTYYVHSCTKIRTSTSAAIMRYIYMCMYVYIYTGIYIYILYIYRYIYVCMYMEIVFATLPGHVQDTWYLRGSLRSNMKTCFNVGTMICPCPGNRDFLLHRPSLSCSIDWSDCCVLLPTDMVRKTPKTWILCMKKESQRPPISEGRPVVETPRRESITKRLYMVEKAHTMIGARLVQTFGTLVFTDPPDVVAVINLSESESESSPSEG